MSHVALLGTGLLGSGMAEHMIRRGEPVVVWNRTPEKTAPLVAMGARVAASPEEAVIGASRVHLVLSADKAVDAVIGAMFDSIHEGAFLFDHSTNAPGRVAERHDRLRGLGIRYVPAPVFMSPHDGKEGTGLMLVASEPEEFLEIEPLLSPMTGRLWHVGARSDLAAIYKICGNGVLLALAGTMGDLFRIGEANDLTPDQILALFDMFKPGAALPFIGRRVASATQNPPSFELGMARKDVGLMIEAAGGPAGLSVLPGVAASMDQAIAEGLGDRDFAIFARPGRG